MNTIQLEKTNLELHVDLCAQRYAALEQRLDQLEDRLDTLSENIDARFSKIENTLERICQQMESTQTDTQKSYLQWASGVIVILLAVAGWAVSELILQ
tara:strand:+ start:2108 stop:2401 length:294 start_codon:yes stop_codon:yes gene_type:complete